MNRESIIEVAAPPVVVITLNWNRRDDTLAFLASCRQQAYANFRVLVVDNGSVDGSVEAVVAQFPEVSVLENGANLGFAAGMNAGIKVALSEGADYLFLVNNDTTLEPPLLALLVDAARQHEADLVAPAIYYYDQPERLWWLGGKLRPLLLEVRRIATPPPGKRPFEVDFVTGCAMLISRNCFAQIGLFDERFFMYYEDADFCLRARRAGVRVLVAPQAAMYHKVAVSSGGSDSPGERFLTARSSMQYFRKHARPWQWLLIGPYRTGSAIRTLFRLLRRKRIAAVRAFLRGLGEGLTTARR